MVVEGKEEAKEGSKCDLDTNLACWQLTRWSREAMMMPLCKCKASRSE